MSPYLKPENSNCSHSIHHSHITKNRFTCKKAQHMRNNTKRGLNQYIYFRVTKEPELVLVLHHISSTRRQEERSIKITICQKHCLSRSKHRKTSNQLDANKTNRPHKQGQTIKSHSLCTHICNSHKKVDTSLNTSNTRNVQTKNCQIYRSTRVTQRTTQRRVCGPTNSRSLFNQGAQNLKNNSHGQYPKTNVVHTRKCHIWSPNHNRDKPVPKPTHQSGHDNKKKHKQSMSCNKNIILLPIPCQNSRTYMTQFHTNEKTHCCCNDSSPSCKNKVHHSNVFCVCTAKPSKKQTIPFVRTFFHFFCENKRNKVSEKGIPFFSKEQKGDLNP